MPRDVPDLLAPAALVHAEGFAAPLGRYLVEARFDDAQQGSAGDALQGELDEGRRLAGIILVRFDRVRVPSEREEALRLHGLNDGLPADMLVSRMRDLSAANLARHERAVEPDAEPHAELAMIGQRPPDTGDRSLEFDGLFDAVGHCATSWLLVVVVEATLKCNCSVALSTRPRERAVKTG
jgi:hypothetical protein